MLIDKCHGFFNDILDYQILLLFRERIQNSVKHMKWRLQHEPVTILHGFLLFWPDLWICFCSCVSTLLEKNTVSFFTAIPDEGLQLIPLTVL